MLQRLTIRDFAVITATELEFRGGMTVISGETGAGKSLLVDALGFLSGERADAAMVRHGSERAELQAEFALADALAAQAWLREQELDDGGACLLRRVLRADGGSRAWINGRAVTLAQLTELAGLLVEIHGQHAYQSLLSKPAQLVLLDNVGKHDGLLANVAASAQRWRALQRERELLTARGDVADRVALLQHQLQELERDPLEADAVTELATRHRRLANSAELIEATGHASTQVLGDDASAGALALVHAARAALARVIDAEPRLAEVDAMFDAAAIQLDEATALLDRIRDDSQLDPSAFEQLDRQLARLHDLARKHRVAPDALAAVRERIREELAGLEHADSRLDELDGAMAQAAGEWQQAATSLTAARRATASHLGTEVSRLMGELGMSGGLLEIALEVQPGSTPDPHGAERVEFLVTANPDQPPRPLRKVASGGELSRIALAIEVAALDGDSVPTMVFDEVDSGISGPVAAVVGRLLRQLGKRCQVMCVTHLPQVAAHGHQHYRVSKSADSGITQSALDTLDAQGRTEELARLLGGATVSKEARSAARKLLEDANAE
ncbi:DNA repair protein RecN [Solilutibacter silvestris]|uniref:DNA repair protein RecN n=1 Tax=Solilutibacter silvestris TaxID=1645665 RepID=A0A2K1PZ52_9GAMM|nr:DNA repair protein RecN [Lysobacter silvestris]PNS08074.1 recN: DNA repair protein RecN [Lysobacter silvestris]